MNINDEINAMDLTVNQDNLYLEESFTDIDMASIHRLTPVKANGIKDKNRKPIFVGHTQLMTPQGPLPVRTLLEARNLKEAMEEFPEAMKKAIEKMFEELNKMQQKEASRIIVP
ncbi:MAG: cytoplasmic protein [Pseudomonadota bacterium]